VSESKGRILVIRGGAIGDFILTLPVFAALRAHFPAIELEVLGYAHIAQLALLGGMADAVRSIEARALASFFARHGTLAEEMRDYFSRFALIISFLYDPDGIFQENVARCTRAQFIQGPHRPDDAAAIHATEVFLKPLERLAIFDADPTPRLAVAINGAAKISTTTTAPRLALHSGSGSARKNWPEERWAQFVGRLGEVANLSLLFIGGEAETGRARRLAHCVAQTGGEVEVAENVPLTDLAGRLRQCRFFIGHDSGITHLAAAVGLPGLVLWGDSAEAVWRPRSDRMRVLRSPGELAELEVDKVLAALEDLLPPPGADDNSR
jgi:ADP-heptose:LPS heptosyltransferase